MLFSSATQCYRCPNCDTNYTNSIPTSIFPMITVLLAAFVAWAVAIEHFTHSRALVFTLSAGLSLASFPLNFVIISRLLVPWERSKQCPVCNAQLESLGGGFIDGGRPSLFELLLYSSILVPPFCLYIVSLF